MKERLTNEQIQVALTATFGDGSMRVGLRGADYSTNCKKLEYITFKKELLGDLVDDIKLLEKNGYSQTHIYSFRTKSHPEFKKIHEKPLFDKLEMLDELGIALWMYDDGSIHNKHHFYNINTHSFDELDNKRISVYLNEKLGIYSRVMTERKKDGRIFYYIFVPPCGGAYKLSEIMAKYPIEEYSYKLYPEDKLKALKAIHEYVSYIHLEGTETHFKETTSLVRRFGGYKKKNPNLSVEDFLQYYAHKPKRILK